jgi:hypothetical protein
MSIMRDYNISCIYHVHGYEYLPLTEICNYHTFSPQSEGKWVISRNTGWQISKMMLWHVLRKWYDNFPVNLSNLFIIFSSSSDGWFSVVILTPGNKCSPRRTRD